MPVSPPTRCACRSVQTARSRRSCPPALSAHPRPRYAAGTRWVLHICGLPHRQAYNNVSIPPLSRLHARIQEQVRAVNVVLAPAVSPRRASLPWWLEQERCFEGTHRDCCCLLQVSWYCSSFSGAPVVTYWHPGMHLSCRSLPACSGPCLAYIQLHLSAASICSADAVARNWRSCHGDPNPLS